MPKFEVTLRYTSEESATIVVYADCKETAYERALEMATDVPANEWSVDENDYFVGDICECAEEPK